MAVRQKFTRMPKTEGIMEAGIPAYAIGTLCALSDHANSKNGLCWPSMNRLARILGCSVRTVQRHLHTLKEKGLIEFVERRRNGGRYSSYLYRVVHIVRTTGHGRRVEGRSLYRERTKVLSNCAEHEESREEKREREAKRRREGYEWLFDR